MLRRCGWFCGWLVGWSARAGQGGVNGGYPKSMPTIMRSGSGAASAGLGLGLGLLALWPRARPWRLERSEVVIVEGAKGLRDGGGRYGGEGARDILLSFFLPSLSMHIWGLF